MENYVSASVGLIRKIGIGHVWYLRTSLNVVKKNRFLLSMPPIIENIYSMPPMHQHNFWNCSVCIFQFCFFVSFSTKIGEHKFNRIITGIVSLDHVSSRFCYHSTWWRESWNRETSEDRYHCILHWSNTDEKWRKNNIKNIIIHKTHKS